MLLLISLFIVLSLGFACSTPLWIDRYEVWKQFGNAEYVYSECKGVHFLKFKSLAMFDWDLPDEGHLVDACITIQDREEVINILTSFCKENPDYLFYVEKTVGGVRAWEVSKPRLPRKTTPLMKELNVDPLYIGLINRLGRFGCRVSSKPNRVNEKIEFWCSIGTGVFDERLMNQWAEYSRALKNFDLA